LGCYCCSHPSNYLAAIQILKRGVSNSIIQSQRLLCALFVYVHAPVNASEQRECVEHKAAAWCRIEYWQKACQYLPYRTFPVQLKCDNKLTLSNALQHRSIATRLLLYLNDPAAIQHRQAFLSLLSWKHPSSQGGTRGRSTARPTSVSLNDAKRGPIFGCSMRFHIHSWVRVEVLETFADVHGPPVSPCCTRTSAKEVCQTCIVMICVQTHD